LVENCFCPSFFDVKKERIMAVDSGGIRSE